MDKLTPQLNDAQIRQNIDALQRGGLPNDKVQAYVDNYTKGTNGMYVLKSASSQTQQSQGLNQNGSDISYGNTKIVGGLAGNTLSPVVQFGKDIAAGASGVLPESQTGVGDIKTANQKISDDTVNLIKLIQTRESKGMDTTSLKTALKNEVSPTQYEQLYPEINKTNEQVLGDAEGTGVLALSGGALQGGVEAASAGGIGQGILTGAKIGAGFGAAGSVADSMSQNGSVGDVVKSGIKGAAVGGLVGGAVGGAGGLTGKLTDITDKLGTQSTKGASTSDITKSAVNDTTPSYNKSLIGESGIKNPDGTITPRVSEAKGLKTRTVNPTTSEVAAGNELATVKGYDPKATSLDKYNTVQDEISSRAKSFEQSLKNESVLRPPKEVMKVIKDAVNTASENSLLLQKTDPVVKNYLRVAQRAITQEDGTLAGERAVQKTLDNAYEDAGGKYSNNKALDQVHRSARNALIDDMESHAQTTEVKASLKSMRNLYNASDVLQDKAKLEGGSKLEQLMKKYPVTTKIAKAVGKPLGIGEAVHMISP